MERSEENLFVDTVKITERMREGVGVGGQSFSPKKTTLVSSFKFIKFSKKLLTMNIACK